MAFVADAKDAAARPSPSAPASSAAAHRTRHALPADVQRFVRRAELCEHFAGEFNGDGSARDREVTAQLARNCCDRIDAELNAVRRRHAGDAAVGRELKPFE